MKRRTQKRELKVFAEILQNGVSVVSVAKPLRRGMRLSITNHYRGDLALPLYPLGEDIEVIHCHNNNAVLHLDRPWMGMVTSEGKVHEINGIYREQAFSLHGGDYATLNWSDLTLLVRIGTDRASNDKIPRNKSYRGKTLSLFFREKTEYRATLLAMLAAVLVLTGFTMGLTLYPDDRPRRFDDLTPNYILPFIAPPHLKTAPEALQFNIDRTRFIHSVVRYYRTLAGMLMGYGDLEEHLVHRSTLDRYRELHRRRAMITTEKVDTRHTLDQEMLQREGSALIGFASVQGETYQGKLLRLIDKIDILHYSFVKNLEIRRKLMETFHNDPTYDYTDYREERTVENAALRQLARIRPWDGMTDEALMYQQGESLAGEAERIQSQIFGNEHRHQAALTIDNARPVYLDPLSSNTTFLISLEGFTDEKLEQLEGSVFGVKKKTVKEPLIGHIEPDLVKKFMKEKRFELRLCYEKTLRRNDAIQGEMHWRWIINSRGKALEVNLVRSTIRDGSLVQCIRNKIRSWRFPRPRRGSIEISHSMSFKPEKA